MKSERRHDLEANALLAWFLRTWSWILEKWEPVKPFSQTILGVVIIAIVGLVVIQWLTVKGPQENNLGWAKVFSAIDADEVFSDNDGNESLESIAKDNASRAPGQWAALLVAQQYLQAESEIAFTSPDPGSLELDKAIKLFETLIDTTDDKFLKTKALFGKAQALELKATDDALKKALETYTLITGVWPDSSAAKEAQRRINHLNDPQIIGEDGFYAWYRSQDFKPAATLPGLPGNLNSFLPGSPGISFDDIGDSDLVPGPSPQTDPITPVTNPKAPGTETGSGTPDDKTLVPSKFSDDPKEADGTKAVEEKAAPAAESVEEKTAEPAAATKEAVEKVTEEATEEDSASE